MKLAGCEVLFSPARGNEQASGTDGRNWSPVGHEPTLSLSLARSAVRCCLPHAEATGNVHVAADKTCCALGGWGGNTHIHRAEKEPRFESRWSSFHPSLPLPPAVLQYMFSYWDAVPSCPYCLSLRTETDDGAKRKPWRSTERP